MQFEKRTFDNGLRVIVSPMQDARSVILLVLFGTGSKYETKRINGISHFLEHMFFKGTKSRPKTGQINRDLDRLGAQHNAFTTKELTGYYVKTASGHFDTVLEIVADILLEPIFIGKEIEKERGVILQEISMYEDNPMRHAYDIFEELLYGDQPAGWDTAGYPETVKNITRQDIINYRNDHYLASNAVVVVAGNIESDQIFSKIKKAFSRISVGRKVSKLKVKEAQKAPQIKFKKKDVDQTHVRLGVRAFDMYDARRFPLMVLQTVLGGNSSSHLFMELREKLGLTYYVNSTAEQYTDTGYLVAAAGVPHNSLQKVAKKIIDIFRNAKAKGVSRSDIKHAKEYIRGSMALSFETTDEVAIFLATQELFYRKIMMPDAILKKVEEVSNNDVIKVARDIFKSSQINLAAIGPNEDIENYKSILSNL